MKQTKKQGQKQEQTVQKMPKRYLCLHADGRITVVRTKPRYVENLHGWTEILPTAMNAQVCSGVALYCAHWCKRQ